MRTIVAAALFAWLLGGTALAQQGSCGAPGAAVMPPEQKIYARTMRRLAPADLTTQQQTQIAGLIGQFAQRHPAGSPLDRGAMRELRLEIAALLTPDQKEAMREARQARQAQRANAAGANPAGMQSAAAQAPCPPAT